MVRKRRRKRRMYEPLMLRAHLLALRDKRVPSHDAELCRMCGQIARVGYFALQRDAAQEEELYGPQA